MINLKPYLKGTIPEHMLNHGLMILEERLKPIRILFEQRRVPATGWDDDLIKELLTLFSWMDSDKDVKGVRIGEREARVASPLISELAYGFCHGIGRSGSISSPQPKAGGASILSHFSRKLALDMLQRTGTPNLASTCVLPLATGMAVGLTAAVAREETGKDGVVYPRVDHSSPRKGLKLVGMKVKEVETEVVGDAVKVSPEKIAEIIGEDTAAILSTTTFFPPREPDDVKAISRLANDENLFHIINNAYGVQSRKVMKLVQGAIDSGRVDAVIQSSDKNFLTPVGGSIVASPDPAFSEKVSRMYAGRASAAPISQLLAALLSLGLKGYEQLRDEQERNRALLEERLGQIARDHDERLLEVFNPIAVAMTLNNHKPKEVGYRMYSLRVTGPRVLEESDFGTCCPRYHSPYLTMNAAIGSSEDDIEKATETLVKVLKQTRT